jgi:ornithine carbamoyltransferase
MTAHFLTLADLGQDELIGLIERARALKSIAWEGGYITPLKGKTLAMVFEKASTRTRVSFEVAMVQLGGHAVMMARRDVQIGRGESMPDTARVLSRYVDGIMMRTFDHRTLEELAAWSTVPVINGLTDLCHPCQVLADLLTVRECLGTLDVRVVYVGDGNNMAHSWINAARVLGFELVLACPEAFGPDAAVLEAAMDAGAQVVVSHGPVREATAGAHVVTTDVWASMGQEAEAKQRAAAFASYQVDAAAMAAARPDAIFLHCLPAHRGEEVSAEVIDGPQSRVFDEAENRLHAQKAILEWLIGGRSPA